ncbi:MAG: diaminopimelate epimerase, partial [Solirubrobacterales bacterium]
MKFEKWQALGNDYLIVEADDLPAAPSQERIRLICDRNFGLGGDGVILVEEPVGSDAVAALRIFNPDGSEAELSGNGAREAIMYLRRRGIAPSDSFTVETMAGPVTPTLLEDGRCSVAMGTASTASDDYPQGADDGIGSLSAAGREWKFRHVAVGNPQCAIEVAGELEDLDLSEIGPEIENNALFPNRTNASFYRVSGTRVRARIFERGVGETLSSGTGAIGAAVAAHLGGAPQELIVELDGGELLVT